MKSPVPFDQRSFPLEAPYEYILPSVACEALQGGLFSSATKTRCFPTAGDAAEQRRERYAHSTLPRRSSTAKTSPRLLTMKSLPYATTGGNSSSAWPRNVQTG